MTEPRVESVIRPEIVRRTWIVGTRASTLAMAQTGLVLARLRSAHPALSLDICQVRTEGDRDQKTPLAQLGGRGVFVKEIENALLTGKIDLAVHSLKDMPSVVPEGLAIAAFLPREDARDALVSRLGPGLDDLPRGARIGASSLRRSAQLRAYRPDLQLTDVRGNVDTRLRKLEYGEYDAIVLALAGLIRLGLKDRATSILPVDLMLPAVGQGALCVEVRAADRDALALVQPLDDPVTRAAALAERSLLQTLGGGCQVPIAGYATLQGDELTLRGLVADAAGTRILRGTISGESGRAAALGRELAGRLLAGGGKELLWGEGAGG